MATTWEIELQDKVSGPATKAAAALGGVSSEADKLKASAKAGGTELDRMFKRDSNGKLRDLNGRFVSGAENASRFGGALGGAGSGLAAIGGPAALAAAGIAAVTIAAGLAIKALSAFGAGVAQGFDTARTIKGVANILGKGVPGAADKALDAILDIQRKTAAPIEDITESFNKLTQAGFDSKQAAEIATIRQNLQAAGKEGDIFLDKLRDLKKEFEITGDISDAVLEDLSESLGGSQKFMEALSEATGKSVKELKKLQADKKLKDLPGIQEAITKTAIKLGKEFDGLSKASKPLGERLKSIAEIAFTEMGRGINLDFLGDIFKLLESDDAKKLFQDIGKGLNVAVGVLKKFGSGFLKAFGPAIPELKKLGSAVLKAFGFMDKDAVASIGSLAGVLGVMAAQALVFGIKVAAGAALAIAGFMKFAIGVANMATAAMDRVTGMRDMIKNTLFTIAAVVQELGFAVSEGFANGITSGITMVITAAKSLAAAVKGAVAGALEIKSPSRIFMGYGDMTTAGFAKGMEGGSSDVQRATKGTFSPDALQRSLAGSSALSAPSGGAGNTITINVEVNGEGGDLADVIARRVAEVLDTTATA
ncbi:MAG: hypothetical protein ACPHCN_06520 [Mycobacterium sp.]